MAYLTFGNDDYLSGVRGSVGSLGTHFGQVIGWQASACNATLTTIETGGEYKKWSMYSV